MKKYWNDPKFRKEHTGKAHGNYGRVITEIERKKISNGVKKYREKIKGTKKEIELIQHLSEGHKKSFLNNPKLKKKMKNIVNNANKIKIEKHKKIKESLLPEMNKLRQQNWSYQQIANNFDMKITTVYNWINNKTLN